MHATDADRIAELEREVTELRARVDRLEAAVVVVNFDPETCCPERRRLGELATAATLSRG